MNLLERREYDRSYRERNRERVRQYALKYYHSPKGQAAAKKYRNSDKCKETAKKHEHTPERIKNKRINIEKWKLIPANKDKCKAAVRAHYIKLRSKVIALYTDNKNVCMDCGGKIQELHHINPADGQYEKKAFGYSKHAAFKHQIEQYGKNKQYIVPLCKRCHLARHGRVLKLRATV